MSYYCNIIVHNKRGKYARPNVARFVTFWIIMYLCRVTGTVVAPQKHETLRHARLLSVHPIDKNGAFVGRKDMVALDPRFSAGVDDVVLVAKQGQVVHQIMEDADVPANLIVVGVVDEWR